MRILYVPKHSVIPEHVRSFFNREYVPIDFQIDTPTPRYRVERNIERSLSGRPCIFKEKSRFTLGVTAKNIKEKDKKRWIEFVYSTSCGEVVLINSKTLPSSCWVQSNEAIITTVPQIDLVNKHIFDLSFEIEWWNLGDK